MKECEQHKILIIDDDREFTGLLAKNFEKLECEVVVANSIAEARIILAQDGVTLVALDLKFPGDDKILSGLLYIKEVKTLYPKIGIIVLTGNSTQQAAIAALNSGADAFIVKPFSMQELNALIEDLLSKNNEKEFYDALERTYFRIGRAYKITLDALEDASKAAQEIIEHGKANGVIIDAYIKERNAV